MTAIKPEQFVARARKISPDDILDAAVRVVARLGAAGLSADTIDAGRLSIAPKQNEQRSLSETPPFVGQIAQARSQFVFRRSTGLVTDHRTVGGNDLAGPTF